MMGSHSPSVYVASELPASGLRLPRVGAQRFERLYAENPDPWGYESSSYERDKYAATLAALGERVYGRALEVGCSNGVFTEQLAEHCDSLLAIDFAASAVDLARRRLRIRSNVEVHQLTFPEQAPAGPWDLIVCSEVLYYLDPPALAKAVDWLKLQLWHGAVVLVVDWRGPARTEPLGGDELHELLLGELGEWHTLDARNKAYRLDRFEGSC
jgi:hypothetical protein